MSMAPTLRDNENDCQKRMRACESGSGADARRAGRARPAGSFSSSFAAPPRSAAVRITSRTARVRRRLHRPGRASSRPTRPAASQQQQASRRRPGRRRPTSTSDQGGEERRGRVQPGRAGPAPAAAYAAFPQTLRTVRRSDAREAPRAGHEPVRGRRRTTPAAFAERAHAALAALAACPGYRRGELARALDDPRHWCLVTEWESVGRLPAGARRLRRQGPRHPAAGRVRWTNPPRTRRSPRAEPGGEVEVAASDRAADPGRLSRTDTTLAGMTAPGPPGHPRRRRRSSHPPAPSRRAASANVPPQPGHRGCPSRRRDPASPRRSPRRPPRAARMRLWLGIGVGRARRRCSAAAVAGAACVGLAGQQRPGDQGAGQAVVGDYFEALIGEDGTARRTTCSATTAQRAGVAGGVRAAGRRRAADRPRTGWATSTSPSELDRAGRRHLRPRRQTGSTGLEQAVDGQTSGAMDAGRYRTRPRPVDCRLCGGSTAVPGPGNLLRPAPATVRTVVRPTVPIVHDHVPADRQPA